MGACWTRCIVAIACALVAASCSGREERAEVVARAPAPREAGGEGQGPPSGAGLQGDRTGLVVDVAGVVRRPGVYRMPHGARVHDAIRAAGGARRGANLAALNRAAPLVDGQQVLVAAAETAGGPAGSPPAPAATAGAAPAPVSLNAADAAALDTLPGIGPVTAARIVAEREASGPFASVDDLDRVPGIGPATVEALRDVVTP